MNTDPGKAFDRLMQIDSTAIGKSIAALAAIPRPEVMVRIIQEVPIRELEYHPQGEDFPEVYFYGDRVEICDSDYELVNDHYAEWVAGRHE